MKGGINIKHIKTSLNILFLFSSFLFFLYMMSYEKKESVIINKKIVTKTSVKKNALYNKLDKEIKEDYSYKDYYNSKEFMNYEVNDKSKDIDKLDEIDENIILEDSKIILEQEEIENEEVIIEEKLDEALILDNNDSVIEQELNDKKEDENRIDKIEEEIIDDNNKEDIIEENDNIAEEENLIVEDNAVTKSDEEKTEDIEIQVTNKSHENNEGINKETEENKITINKSENIKNGFVTEDNVTYYYENDRRIIGTKNIDGTNHFFSPIGKYLGTSNIKVIDVSYYQGSINWDLFASESNCYGVILRLGYYDTLDKKFDEYIKEIKRLNIPYGIYLFSYSTTITGANKEADFTNLIIDKYDLNPVLGIYYDIESWSSKNGASSNNISKEMYDNIVQTYINKVSLHVNYNYKVKVYSGRWYAMNRLGSIAKSYVDWVAEYNKTCKYDGNYSMWQYTSKGRIPGINGNVDINYLY